MNDQDAQLLHLDQQLCFKLYSASRLVNRAYQPMLKDLGITYPQYIVLMVLWQFADEQLLPCDLGSIGQRLYLDSGTLTPLLKRLEQTGFIQRQRAVEDERQLQIRLTEAGYALRQQALAWRKGLTEQGFDIDSVNRLRSDLDELLSVLQL